MSSECDTRVSAWVAPPTPLRRLTPTSADRDHRYNLLPLLLLLLLFLSLVGGVVAAAPDDEGVPRRMTPTNTRRRI